MWPVANCKLKDVKACKYLSVLIDENLKWDDHTDFIYKKNGQVYWYII